MYAFIIAVVIVLVLLGLFLLWRKRRAARDERELIALVFLLPQPRELPEELVRDAIERVWDLKLAREPRRSGDWLIEAGQLSPALARPDATNYLVDANDRMFLINSVRRPYVDDPEKLADSIPDLRLRRAICSHRAWISVDLYGEPPTEEEKPVVYALLGKLLAEFAGDDCLALFCPETQRCNEYAPEMVERLRAGQALSILENPTHSPIIQVEGTDPRMVAAVEEANRRWPEFVAALATRKCPEDIFAVKARFSEGEEEEFMWVSVDKIDGEKILGRLGNSPAMIKSLREGDYVTVSRENLNDWLYGYTDGQPVGGFTMKVMEEIMKK